MKKKRFAAVLPVLWALTACTPQSEPPPPEDRRPDPGDAIQRPLDRAESAEDTLMRSHQERDRQLDEQE